MTTTKLKIIACLAMLLDHLGHYLDFIILHIIGRIAFPIFAYLIVEGFFHTKNIKKYLIRLFAFAIISQIPFTLFIKSAYVEFDINMYLNFSIYLNGLNIFFTLFLGLVSIYIFDKNKKIGIITLIILGIITQKIHMDYGIYGILTIFSFYYFRGYFWKQTISFSILTILKILKLIIRLALTNYSMLVNHLNIGLFGQIFSVLALIFIYKYNGKKGKNIKYFFYVFYPAHLLALFFLEPVLTKINQFLLICLHSY